MRSGAAWFGVATRGSRVLHSGWGGDSELRSRSVLAVRMGGGLFGDCRDLAGSCHGDAGRLAFGKGSEGASRSAASAGPGNAGNLPALGGERLVASVPGRGSGGAFLP